MKSLNVQMKYLVWSESDEQWGAVVTTVGHQHVQPQSSYPVQNHPDSHSFNPNVGRVLNEYQLVYITRGSGYFSSSYVSQRRVTAGSVILLFPGEWHSYYPDKDSGWQEYWVGFKGRDIDFRIDGGFFSREEPVIEVGVNATVLGYYNEILELSNQERSGCQQLISSIVVTMLGNIYYISRNNQYKDDEIINKINQARTIIKDSIQMKITPEQIAHKLGMSYSWFRRTFKEYTGVSPAHYIQQQRFIKSKELLVRSSLNISEIAYNLQFESVGQFSTFFKKYEGITPSQFKNATSRE